MFAPASPEMNRSSFFAASIDPLALSTVSGAAAEPSEKRIEGPQGKLRLYRSGSGPRILFLHSDGGRSQQWREVIDLLHADFEACALDFRGHGESDPAANGDYSFAGRAEDAIAAADEMEWDRFLVVAHSGGCAVALAVAGSHSERVAGVLLVDPLTDPRAIPQEDINGMLAGLSGPDSLSFLKQYYLSLAGPDPVVQAHVLADAEATTTASREGLGKALAEWDPEIALDGYDGPVLILGTEGRDGPNALYMLRPEIPHRVVKGTGHWLQIERPDLVAEAIRELAKTAQDKNAI